MSCRKMRMLVQSYADGEATRAEREAVERHVAECRACEKELEQARSLAGMLGATPTRTLSADFERNLMAAIRSAETAPAPAAWWERFRLHFEWRLRVPALVTAGSLAVAVIAGVATLRIQDANQAERDRQEYVSTAVERYHQLEAADEKTDWDEVDASIELNSGSIITE